MGTVTYLVVAGPVKHQGRFYQDGETIEVSEAAGAALVAAGAVAAGVAEVIRPTAIPPDDTLAAFLGDVPEEPDDAVVTGDGTGEALPEFDPDVPEQEHLLIPKAVPKPSRTARKAPQRARKS